MYNYPHQWGSKRTGPDLHRQGGKYPNLWHYRHMGNPRSTSPGSNMPNYPWLFENDTDVASLPAKIKVQRQLGVPYPKWTDEEIQQLVDQQEQEISNDLQANQINAKEDREIIAIIAYLQKLGASETIEIDDTVDATIETANP